MIDDSHFPAAKAETTFVAPQVLINVDHSMLVMMEETFGPVIGIMKASLTASEGGQSANRSSSSPGQGRCRGHQAHQRLSIWIDV